MQYQELISHLYHLKILAYLDQYKITLADYFSQVKDTAKLETELALLENPNELTKNKQTQKEIIDLKAEARVGFHKEKVQLEIDNLINEAGFEKPLFGNLAITFNNLLDTFQKSKFKELRSYIFGKDWFKKQIQNIKSNQQIIDEYNELTQASINDDFTQFLSLLQAFQVSLMDSLDTRIKTFSEALKTTGKDNKGAFIKQSYLDLETRIKHSNYILVGTALKSSKIELVDLANLINWFTKTNGLNFDSFQLQQEQILRFFSDLHFSKYIEINHLKQIEQISLNDEEIFIVIQNRNKLIEVVLPSYLNDFETIEKTLIKEGYFNTVGTWKKEKKLLVEFIFHCFEYNYFKYNKNRPNFKKSYLLKLRRFFELRYSIIIENQFKPSNRTFDLPSFTFNWVEQAK